MKHEQFLNLLNSYTPTDLEEQEYKKRMLNFAQNYENCFERSLTIGHFTASAFLLNKEQTHALLMHHTKLDIWVQPGGHCDGNSNVLEVAIKEAQEESGILGVAAVQAEIFDIDIHRIPANKKEAAHDHYDVRFLLRVTSDEQLVQNRESKELRWVGPELHELPTRERSVVRMFEKWHKLNSNQKNISKIEACQIG